MLGAITIATVTAAAAAAVCYPAAARTKTSSTYISAIVHLTNITNVIKQMPKTYLYSNLFERVLNLSE